MIRLLCLVGLIVSSQSIAELLISDATIRLLPPGLPNTSAYFTITNIGDTPRYLVAASSDIAATVELHTHVMRGEMVSMEKQIAVEIPAMQKIHFAPGGLHLMIFGLHSPLRKEQNVSITLQTKSGEVLTFVAIVEEPKPQSHHH